jgi:DEAD/DEAH box helicase domain-containing protein
LPTNVFPNLTQGNLLQGKYIGNLLIIESQLQVREAIIGYTETQGSKKINFQYPTNGENSIFYDQKYFSRNFFTTGIIISHPVFNNAVVSLDKLCGILYEAFLMIVPFERRDIACAYDRHRQTRALLNIDEDSKFVAIYDRTYGSLRLTSRIFSNSVFLETLKKALEISIFDEYKEINNETKEVLKILLDELQNEESTVEDNSEKPIIDSNLVKILLPNSHGLILLADNTEYIIEDVFPNLITGKLSYRGKYTNSMDSDTKIILPIDSVIGVNGESSYGYYSLNTGEISKENNGR